MVPWCNVCQYAWTCHLCLFSSFRLSRSFLPFSFFIPLYYFFLVFLLHFPFPAHLSSLLHLPCLLIHISSFIIFPILSLLLSLFPFLCHTFLSPPHPLSLVPSFLLIPIFLLYPLIPPYSLLSLLPFPVFPSPTSILSSQSLPLLPSSVLIFISPFSLFSYSYLPHSLHFFLPPLSPIPIFPSQRQLFNFPSPCSDVYCLLPVSPLHECCVYPLISLNK